MRGDQSVIIRQALKLASEMPSAMVEALAEAIQQSCEADWPSRRTRVLHSVSQPHYRGLVSDFLEAWEHQASNLSCQAVATSLSTASASEASHREGQTVELVWTGPDTEAIPVRHTEQALLEVVDSASQRITLISYAVYRIPRIKDALVSAADRGVSLSIILETADPQEGSGAYDTTRALGERVSARSQLYVWPRDERDRQSQGKPGILHVKGAVADSRWLYLSSANLTEYAFTVNMELGVLITGGPVPGRVERHFDQLIEANVLRNCEERNIP